VERWPGAARRDGGPRARRRAVSDAACRRSAGPRPLPLAHRARPGDRATLNRGASVFPCRRTRGIVTFRVGPPTPTLVPFPARRAGAPAVCGRPASCSVPVRVERWSVRGDLTQTRHRGFDPQTPPRRSLSRLVPAPASLRQTAACNRRRRPHPARRPPHAYKRRETTATIISSSRYRGNMNDRGDPDPACVASRASSPAIAHATRAFVRGS